MLGVPGGAQFALHDMATTAFAPNLLKASRLEHGYEPHEPVARRVFVNRIGFQDPGSARAGVLDGCSEHSLGQASASVLPEHEEADDGPDAFI